LVYFWNFLFLSWWSRSWWIRKKIIIFCCGWYIVMADSIITQVRKEDVPSNPFLSSSSSSSFFFQSRFSLYSMNIGRSYFSKLEKKKKRLFFFMCCCVVKTKNTYDNGRAVAKPQRSRRVLSCFSLSNHYFLNLYLTDWPFYFFIFWFIIANYFSRSILTRTPSSKF
jgi:hypothetical protein